MDVDVLVVGGGPSGCAAARDIAAEGFKVLVMEEHPTIGEPLQCSGLVSPRVLKLAHVSSQVIINCLKGALIHAPDGRTVELIGDKVYGFAIDRVAFDQELALQAQTAGAEIHTSSRVVHLARIAKGVKVRIQQKDAVEQELTCKLVIGADGHKSLVGRWLGLPYPPRKVSLYAAEVELQSANEQIVEIFLGKMFAPGWFAWVIPTGSGSARVDTGIMKQVNSSAESQSISQLFPRLVDMYPHVFKDLRMLKSTGGVLPIGLMEQTYGPHALLVGDAACQIKPISGGGLYLGLEAARVCAQTAVSSLKAKDYSSKFLSNYQQAWQKIIGREIRCGLMHRETFLKMSDAEVNNILAFLDTPYWRRIIFNNADLDYHSILANKLTAAPLWAQSFLINGLISFVNCRSSR